MIGELIPTGVTFGVGRNSLNDAFSGTASLNNVTLDSGGNLAAGIGGGVITSGGTDLYNIFGAGGGGGGDVTRVIGGTNIITGGTDNLPIINLDSDISLTSVVTTAGFSGGNDTNTNSFLGRTAIGYGVLSDWAWISHVDMVASNSWALIQNSVGQTNLNSAAGQPVIISVGNDQNFYMSANTGFVGIGNNQPSQQLHVDGSIRMEDGNEGYGKIPYDTGDGTMAWSAFTFGGSGESNTASNVGAGTGNIYRQKTGVDLELRTLSAGTNIAVTTTDTLVTIEGVSSTYSVHDYGTVSGTVDWDINTDSPNAKLRLSGNITALNILNATSGTFGTLLIEQSTGSHTVTLGAGTHRVVNSGGGSITLTATASARDIITFFYDGSTFYWTVGNDYT